MALLAVSSTQIESIFITGDRYKEADLNDIDRLAREVKDIKALPPVTKRRIGFIIDED